MFTTSLKYWLITTGFAICTLASSAQKLKYEQKADRAAKDQDFYTAAVYYEKAISVQKEKMDEYNPYNGEVIELKANKGKVSSRKKLIFKLAESYRMYNNWEAAAPWYTQAAQFPEPEFQTAKYWNAICLRTKGNYAQAGLMLEQFLKVHTTKDEWTKWANAELANCKFAMEEQKKKSLVKYQANKLPTAVNDQSANYAPVLLSNDMLAFTSSRNTWGMERGNMIPKNNTTISKESHVNDLFIVTLAKMNDTKEANVPIAAMDQGAASFSTDKTRMYITRWTMQNGKKMSSIYLSTQQKDGKWTTPTVLNNYVNANGYSSKQPFISTDGRWLFFSSDRPGGMGKFDIWVCNLGNDGLPSAQATNLVKINTAGEEEAPFYNNSTSQLFFSSNGRAGFGGLDFYVSTGTPGSFSTPINLGEPFNSPKDDVYFTTTSAQDPLSNAYISSDRFSACCLEIVNINRQQQAWTIIGKVINCKDQKVLPGASGAIKDQQNQSTIATATTDANGKYSSPYKEGQKITIQFSKEGFFTTTKDLEPVIDRNASTLTLPDVCLQPIEIDKPIEIPNILYDYDKATLRSESKPILDSLAIVLKENDHLNVELGSHTDSKGSDSYNMRLSEARAKSCVQYLISKGVRKERLTYKGYGETMPIAPNENSDGSDNPEGRQRNRRTEFKILGLKLQPTPPTQPKQ